VAANLFYYDMRNAQRLKPIVIVAPGGFAVGFADLFNAPRARSLGAEAEIDWRVSPSLSTRLSLGLLRTRLIDAGPGYTEFEGNEFARSPHFTIAGSAIWQATSKLQLSLEARHRSGFYADDVNNAAVRIGPSTIVDARAEYRLGRAKAFVYVRNLFNEFALLDRLTNVSGSAEDPRMVGIGLEAGF